MIKDTKYLSVFIIVFIINFFSCSDNVNSISDKVSIEDSESGDYFKTGDNTLNDEVEQDIIIIPDKGILPDAQSPDVPEEDKGQYDICDIDESDNITADIEDEPGIKDFENRDTSNQSDYISDVTDDLVSTKDDGSGDTDDTETLSDLYVCNPQCGENSCGLDDGCGRRCTTCPDGMTCNTNQWKCEVICKPDCSFKECGDDGCGNECPPGCSPGQNCINGKCQICSDEKFGQDYNLTRRCARSVCDKSSQYYYEDTTECTTQSSWLIAVESEASLGASCPGPTNCSFVINGPQSPVTLEWLPHKSECGDNWTVHMLVDHSTYPSPCSGDYWTWFAFMDHQQTGGGPYPPPLNTVSHHTLNFSAYTPSQDASARVFIGGQWWWGGKSRMIEFNLNLQQWGDADPHPGLIVKFETPEFEFLALDASYWGLNIIQGQDTTVEIPWAKILQDAVSFGWFAAPSSWAEVIPMAYFIGTEVKNKGIASLWHTDFRIFKK